MPNSAGCTAFQTAIGRCALCWNSGVVTRVVLAAQPGGDIDSRVQRWLAAGEHVAPPDWIVTAVRRMTAHLAGEFDALRDIPVVQATSAFEREVYALTRGIAPGETRTYGELAQLTGHAARAREVGQAMARNPVPLLVPCHRVVASGGHLGGFSAPGGIDTKRRMLGIERAAAVAQLGIFDR
jgi:methylated-DNA-[protein]-cysteine S-methyltransferase